MNAYQHPKQSVLILLIWSPKPMGLCIDSKSAHSPVAFAVSVFVYVSLSLSLSLPVSLSLSVSMYL